MIIGNNAGGIAYFSSDTTNLVVGSNELEINTKEDFLISPNPAQDIIKISSSVHGIINIYNSVGSIILSKVKNKEEITIRLPNISKGIYVVELNNTVKKLVIDYP